MACECGGTCGMCQKFVIRHEGDEWVLYDHTGSKVLGRHKSEADAQAQERAIQAAKHAHSESPETGDMEMDAEIFSTGTWAGSNWTTTHLDEMVRNFQALKDAIKPPVKLGHEDNQILAGQDEGQPALGWVTGLKREGNKLIAHFSHVPRELFKLIQKRRYARVSAELYPQFEMTSVCQKLNSPVRGCVLTAVALLGADIPEVKNLADLAKIMNRQESDFTFSPCPDGAVACSFTAGGCETWTPQGDHWIVRLSGGTSTGTLTIPFAEGTRNTLPTDHQPSEGIIMTDAEIKALQDKQTKLAEQVENLLTAQAADQKAREAADKERDAAHKKELADRDAKIADLEKRDRERQASEASAKADAAAERFAADRSADGNRKLFGAAKVIAKALHRTLALGANPSVSADEAKGLQCFGEGETARDLSATDLFERFVDSLPDMTRFSETITTSKPAPGSTSGDGARMEAVKTVCKEQGLKFHDHAERKQAFEIAVRDSRFASLWK